VRLFGARSASCDAQRASRRAKAGAIKELKMAKHHVLDERFEEVVKRRMVGSCTLVRFADDFVMTFKHHYDAKRVLEVLAKRLIRYGLTCVS